MKKVGLETLNSKPSCNPNVLLALRFCRGSCHFTDETTRATNGNSNSNNNDSGCAASLASLLHRTSIGAVCANSASRMLALAWQARCDSRSNKQARARIDRVVDSMASTRARSTGQMGERVSQSAGERAKQAAFYNELSVNRPWYVASPDMRKKMNWQILVPGHSRSGC
jgi:hypothetical protein